MTMGWSNFKRVGMSAYSAPRKPGPPPKYPMFGDIPNTITNPPQDNTVIHTWDNLQKKSLANHRSMPCRTVECKTIARGPEKDFFCKRCCTMMHGPSSDQGKAMHDSPA